MKRIIITAVVSALSFAGAMTVSASTVTVKPAPIPVAVSNAIRVSQLTARQAAKQARIAPALAAMAKLPPIVLPVIVKHTTK